MGEIPFRARRVVLAICLSLAAPIVLSAGPAQAEVPGLVWSATVEGQALADATSNSPLPLGDHEETEVVLELDNQSPDEVRIRSVRLEGQVIGLNFFSYSNRLDIVLPAGESTTRRFELDIADLKSQATGLLPSELQLVGQTRQVLDARAFTVDVRGSVLSVYGIFGLAVAGITLTVLASLLIALWRGQLPANRWQRALRFLPVGLGAGLTLTFTLSATRLLAPHAATWVTSVLVLGVGAFILGYLLPQGRDLDERDSDQDEDEDAALDVLSPRSENDLADHGAAPGGPRGPTP